MAWPFAKRDMRTRVFPTIETTPPVRRSARLPVRMPQLARDWPAAEWSDLTADWSFTSATSFNLHSFIPNLRARARKEKRSNDLVRRYVSMLRNGVVGPEGFQLQAQFQDLSGTLDNVAIRAFEAHWRKWANDPDACDVRGRQTFSQMCRQVVGQLPEDGEFLIRQHYTGSMGFALQVIDPVTLDVNHHDVLPGGRRITFGIEVDSFKRPLAYHFARVNERGYKTDDRYRVPASEIYHVYLDEVVDQLRGFPWLSTPMYRMHMARGYEEAALVNARAGAAKMGFIKSDEPEGYEGEDTSPAGAPIEALEAGTVGHLAGNESWVGYDPSYPSGEFKDFMRMMNRTIASGLEASYPTLANDLEGVNYTSLRHDALEVRDVFMALQKWLIDTFCMRLYRQWLTVQLVRGIPIPKANGGSREASIERRAKWEQVKFQGRRWQSVDPLKEVQATQLAIQLGITTRSQAIRDQGRDPEEVFSEWEVENERLGPVQASASAGGPSDNGSDPASIDGGAQGDQPGQTDG